MIRKIIHIDMDAFFASIEQRDFPEYRGKPVAVGYPEARSVVSAASYEARKFGIHSAMPSLVALRKCKDLIFAAPRFDAYKEASDIIMNIFREFTDLVEPMSLDEAYLDVTENLKGIKSATHIAIDIRRRIKQSTQLTASAGVSFNKFLAKVASDYKKPDGLFVIEPKDADKFIISLPVGKIPYIGKVTESKMRQMGINTGGDLRKMSLDELMVKFGKVGKYYHDIVWNKYDNPVVTEHLRKSIGAERTFENDISDEKELLEELDRVCSILIRRMKKYNLKGKSLTVKFRYDDFDTKSRSKTFDHWINPDYDLKSLAHELFTTPIIPQKPIRLIGVQVSGLDNTEEENLEKQLTLEF